MLEIDRVLIRKVLNEILTKYMSNKGVRVFINVNEILKNALAIFMSSDRDKVEIITPRLRFIISEQDIIVQPLSNNVNK